MPNRCRLLSFERRAQLKPMYSQALLFMKDVNFPLNEDMVYEVEDSWSAKEIILRRVLLSESEGKSYVLLINISV